jgi:hypothetical protein
MTLFLIILAIIFLAAGAYFLFFVSKPHSTQQPPLAERVAAFSAPDPNANIVSNKFTRIKTESYTATARASLEAAQVTTFLHNEHEKAVITDAAAPLRLRNELIILGNQGLTLENQKQLLEHATEYGVSLETYSEVVKKVLLGKADTLLKAEETKQTIEVALLVTDRHFKEADQLRGRLLQLRLDLEDLRQRELPESVKKIHMQDFENDIARVDKQLKEHLGQALVSETDGQKY